MVECVCVGAAQRDHCGGWGHVATADPAGSPTPRGPEAPRRNKRQIGIGRRGAAGASNCHRRKCPRLQPAPTHAPAPTPVPHVPAHTRARAR
eukprot:2999100-Alexandrium_andersonii.AAC.2